MPNQLKIDDLVKWRFVARNILLRGLKLKFAQNSDLKNFLLDTKNTKIVECDPKDKFWSCGLEISSAKKQKYHDWRGYNVLGYLLQLTRKELK